MGKTFISDYKEKDKIDSFFLLHKKNLKLTKHDKPYLELGLGDKTGNIEGRLWERAEDFAGAADTGDVVRVTGSVEKYRGDNQLKIDFIEKADEGSFRQDDMVCVAENRDKTREDVFSYLESIKNPWICLLVKRFTSDETLMSLFADGIGAKRWHNAYIGGLMEHTYEVMRVVEAVCELYPEADRDIAVFGAFIHDIGKVLELDPKKMEYTDQGGLLGHIAIGHKILVERIRKIPGFPDELGMRLEHIILSHHGEYEQQSPVLPKTLEAVIVYQTDDLVSQANAIKQILTSQAAKEKTWSNFVSIKNRKFYIKDFVADEKKISKKP
ncbi:MAG: HD domain-containing protein [Candidatus Omnitrophota bacterium]